MVGFPEISLLCVAFYMYLFTFRQPLTFCKSLWPFTNSPFLLYGEELIETTYLLWIYFFALCMKSSHSLTFCKSQLSEHAKPQICLENLYKSRFHLENHVQTYLPFAIVCDISLVAYLLQVFSPGFCTRNLFFQLTFCKSLPPAFSMRSLFL